MSKVLDDFRETFICDQFAFDTETATQIIIAQRQAARKSWDAAIDLLPVLFAEWKDRHTRINRFQETIYIYANNNQFVQEVNNNAELYTYWKDNILKPEDLNN